MEYFIKRVACNKLRTAKGFFFDEVGPKKNLGNVKAFQ